MKHFWTNLIFGVDLCNIVVSHNERGIKDEASGQYDRENGQNIGALRLNPQPDQQYHQPAKQSECHPAHQAHLIHPKHSGRASSQGGTLLIRNHLQQLTPNATTRPHHLLQDRTAGACHHRADRDDRHQDTQWVQVYQL